MDEEDATSAAPFDFKMKRAIFSKRKQLSIGFRKENWRRRRCREWGGGEEQEGGGGRRRRCRERGVEAQGVTRCVRLTGLT
jgi:hypothetical protein